MAIAKKATTNKATTKVATPAAKSSGNGNRNSDRAKIAELLKKLEAATLRSEKQQIRRQLRAQGHRGGMNRKPGAGLKAK